MFSWEGRYFCPIFPGSIDNTFKVCYILFVKSFDERHAFPERTSERSPFGARASVHCRDRYHFPSCGAEMLRRSRPLSRQWVTAKAVTRVEPWNTLYPTPDSVQGMGLFLYLPRGGSSEEIRVKSEELWNRLWRWIWIGLRSRHHNFSFFTIHHSLFIYHDERNDNIGI